MGRGKSGRMVGVMGAYWGGEHKKGRGSRGVLFKILDNITSQ